MSAWPVVVGSKRALFTNFSGLDQEIKFFFCFTVDLRQVWFSEFQWLRVHTQSYFDIFTFFILHISKHYFVMEKQEAIVDAEQVKKPRKRFVGRAKKAASTANNEAGGAIEDGAVGFASKVFNMPTLNKLLITLLI